MSFLSIIFILVILLWTFIHTVSYGLWTWKKNNKSGAVVLFALSLIVLGFPLYLVFSRS